MSADERARVRRARGVADDGLLAVSAAPMRRGQGHDLLLDAVAAVPASVPLTVVLVGDGPLRPWLVSRVEADEVLAARVHFEPHDAARPGPRGHRRRRRVPAHQPLGRAAAAADPGARARGAVRRLARRRRPGDRDARHGRCSCRWLADPIADAVVRLAGDPDLRARLGKAARGRFLANFEARGWAVRLRGVYDEVLARVPAEPVSRPVGSGPATLPPSFFDTR